ncbi:membrane-associated, eicosanoid/glutathione metabolism protein [Umbelopsis sp. PMI_123]|nr:membrane-associated, eicosanoid/glutathione metabolism protein [Umbelopsis sp. PMI_123]
MPLTPSLPATAAWAPLFAGYFGYLTYRVMRTRVAAKVSIGDGTIEELQCIQKADGNEAAIARYKQLRTAMRAQANFVEYVPFALLLIAVLESNRANPKGVHALLGALFTARVLHGNFGMFWNARSLGDGRPAGFLLTNGVILTSAVWNGVIGNQWIRDLF